MLIRIDLGQCATRGLAVLRSTIGLMLNQQIFHPDPEKNSLYLVVLDATKSFDPSQFNQAVLLETPFGPEGETFKGNACGKALLSWKTRMDSGDVVDSEPAFVIDGDSKYRGAVYYKGLVVAVSGVKAFWDQTIAMGVAVFAYGFIMQEMDEIKRNVAVDIVGHPN